MLLPTSGTIEVAGLKDEIWIIDGKESRPMNQLDKKAPADIQVRPARIDDAPFLAWVCLASGRSHCQRGIWDVILNRPEQKCLAFLEYLVVTKRLHTYHYSGFVVAEIDGQRAAALSGYNSKELGDAQDRWGCWEAGRKVGISMFDWWRNRKRISAVEAIRPHAAAGAWIIESVATLPEFRRQGLVDRLLKDILEIGRRKGFRLAQVSVFIGNTAAQNAYEKCGFSVIDERRNADFEAETGCPGIARLLRAL